MSLEDSHPMANSNNHEAAALHAPVLCVCSGLVNDEFAISFRLVLRGNAYSIWYTVMLCHHIQSNNT